MTQPAPAASAPLSLRTMGRGTMSRQLVVRVTMLVALIAVALSSLTALSTHLILEQQLDQSLVGRASLASRDDDFGRVTPGDLPPGGGGWGGGGPGQQQGFLLYRNGTGYVQVDRERVVLTLGQAEILATVPTGSGPTTIFLPGLGSYRVLATANGGVIGQPNEPNDRVVLRVIAAAAAMTALAIGAAYVAARRVVEQSLRPLQRLATTATHVSQLELGSGEVNVGVRVPASDTDPRSEVGQVGLAFNHMLDNVEGALEARQRSETKVRQFVADASHELRNPLASIRGYAELTRRERGGLPADTAHALGRIESESERMSHLVEDLLLLARLDSGPHLLLEPVDLTSVVVNAVSDAQVAGPEHRWSVSLPPSGADVIARGDRFRLHQVLANVLANARTHTPAGTAVETRLTTENGFAVVSVTDNGPGIPEGIRDRVFERFTRADVARARSGKGTSSTGLGLAIVAAVLGAHGGNATVESVEGGGTTVTIRVPLA